MVCFVVGNGHLESGVCHPTDQSTKVQATEAEAAKIPKIFIEVRHAVCYLKDTHGDTAALSHLIDLLDAITKLKQHY